MSTVLLFGGTGMIGKEFARALAHCKLVAPPHTRVDIADADAVERLVAQEKPDFIINAAAIIDLQAIEKDPMRAMRVNVQGAEAIAHAAAAHKIPQLLMSSSYVFSGSTQPYAEDAERNPANTYGKTKVEAEDAVVRCGSSAPYYIVRTSWIYSPYRATFVDEAARMLRQAKPFEASAQRGNPTNGAEFATTVVAHFMDSSANSGVCHLINEGDASRYDIAREITHALGISKDLVIAKSFLSTATRPSALLANTKLPKLRPWKESLRAYIIAKYGQGKRFSV